MKFWKEFKAFISKGNIVDLAVAVVIGTAFNKIVSSLVNDIIMPLITWALGANSLAELSVVLQTDAEGVATLTWNYGSFIQAIIDFLIIALSIFIVLKIVMKSSSLFKDATNKIKAPTKEEKKILKERGVNLKDWHAVKLALAELHAEQAKEKAEKEAKEKEDKFKNSTEGLLTEIRDLLKENAELKSKIADKKEKDENKE
ncbi:MAG: large conductance mechanosensitive channel protein MscL [Clostridia bacterium]|nr:large conductance mechanosensitive channel protein MscL [Clostridia bacterium]